MAVNANVVVKVVNSLHARGRSSEDKGRENKWCPESDMSFIPVLEFKEEDEDSNDLGNGGVDELTIDPEGRDVFLRTDRCLEVNELYHGLED